MLNHQRVRSLAFGEPLISCSSLVIPTQHDILESPVAKTARGRACAPGKQPGICPCHPCIAPQGQKISEGQENHAANCHHWLGESSEANGRISCKLGYLMEQTSFVDSAKSEKQQTVESPGMRQDLGCEPSSCRKHLRWTTRHDIYRIWI